MERLSGTQVSPASISQIQLLEMPEPASVQLMTSIVCQEARYIKLSWCASPFEPGVIW